MTHRAYTQQRLANELGIDRSTVVRWLDREECPPWLPVALKGLEATEKE